MKDKKEILRNILGKVQIREKKKIKAKSFIIKVHIHNI